MNFLFVCSCSCILFLVMPIYSALNHFHSYLQITIKNKSVYFFLIVGVRLVNEDSSQCRALIAECLESFISRIDRTCYNDLLDLTLSMLQDTKITHREMAAQLLIRMMNVEQELFYARLGEVIPALLFTLSDVCSEIIGQFVRLKPFHVTGQDSAHIQKAKDHSLIQTLNAFNQIFEVYPQVLTCQQHLEIIDDLSYNLQSLLTHQHQWVRRASLNLISIILRSINFETINKILEGEQCETLQRFIYQNPTSEIRSLVLDMCSQMVPAETDDDIASLVSKNLLYIANILKTIPLPKKGDEDVTDDYRKVNLAWLIRRVRYVIQSEVAKAPKSTVLVLYLNYL